MNKDNDKKNHWPITIPLILAVVGLIIGYYQANATMSDKYVQKDQYRCDMKRVEGKLDKITDILMGIKK